MAQVSQQSLPAGYGYEWTGTAYQEVTASGQTGLILGLAVLFSYLFLVGLYESWIIPVPVLLSVPTMVAGTVLPSSKVTETSVTFSTTWWFVTT